MYKVEKVSNPCRNFCVLSSIGFRDPKDGCAKFALVSFANFVCGSLYLIDPKANTAESYTLPRDNGAWALFNYQDEALIIGTCAEAGCVHRFDLKTRTFAQPLRVDSETYIWNFADGGDGFLYGGTYGGCRLVRYNLAQHVLEDLGRVSPNPENLYARYVAHVPGYIIIDVGMSVNEKYVYRQSDGKILPAAEVGNFPDAVEFQKPADSRIGSGCVLPDSSAVCVSGQEYTYFPGNSTEGIIRRIPGDPPATGILTVAADDSGAIWGSSNFGMTIFRFDPKTKT